MGAIKMVHVACDYKDEPQYYHIYGVTEAGEALLDGTIELELPHTAENTADVQAIVDTLDLIAARNFASANSNQGG
jgi:hypothetical protein